MKKIKTYLKKTNISFLVAVFLASILILYGFVHILLWFLDNNKSKRQMNQLEDETPIIEKISTEEERVIDETTISSFDPYWDFINMNYMEVDFSNLMKENSEVVGWISVNGTNINYPVVQHLNNKYYLNHSFNRSRNEAGWVFMDYRNSTNVFDRNTVIYAHGRKNGSMFGSLKNILSSNWYQNPNHYVIKLSTPYENSLWQVFSVYKIPTTSDYIQVHFIDDNTFLSFINKIKERSAYDFKTTVVTRDKVLTLSTCFNDNEKVVMHAKLIKVQKR